MMKRIAPLVPWLVLFVVPAVSVVPAVGLAQTLPDGWTMQRRGDEITLTPSRLEPGEHERAN